MPYPSHGVLGTASGSLRQAMRLFTVDKKTIKKNLLRFMNSEPVLMGRPGPPPTVQASTSGISWSSSC